MILELPFGHFVHHRTKVLWIQGPKGIGKSSILLDFKDMVPGIQKYEIPTKKRFWCGFDQDLIHYLVKDEMITYAGDHMTMDLWNMLLSGEDMLQLDQKNRDCTKKTKNLPIIFLTNLDPVTAMAPLNPRVEQMNAFLSRLRYYYMVSRPTNTVVMDNGEVRTVTPEMRLKRCGTKAQRENKGVVVKEYKQLEPSKIASPLPPMSVLPEEDPAWLNDSSLNLQEENLKEGGSLTAAESEVEEVQQPPLQRTISPRNLIVEDCVEEEPSVAVPLASVSTTPAPVITVTKTKTQRKRKRTSDTTVSTIKTIPVAVHKGKGIQTQPFKKKPVVVKQGIQTTSVKMIPPKSFFDMSPLAKKARKETKGYVYYGDK